MLRKGANFRFADVPAGVAWEALDFLSEDGAASKGLLYRKQGERPRIGVHLMHPRTDQSQNYNILPLAEAGFAVLGRAGRWVNHDLETIHEKLLLDVAAGIRLLREIGCEKIVLLGNSGGSSLAALYQAQAEKSSPARYTDTPAGDPFDLNAYHLPLADALVMVGGHAGEGRSLMAWLDASVTDEDDPFSSDPALDIYNPANGFRIPPDPSRFDPDLVDRVRMAQRARVERLDAIARTRVAARRAAEEEAAAAKDGSARESALRRAAFTNHMVIHRALANPLWLDPTLDADDRDICSYNNNPRPDLANYGTFQAKFLSPEAWLSTWSGLSSRAATSDRLAEVSVPLLMVHYAGDSVCGTKTAREIFDNAASRDKTMTVLPAIDHYGFPITGVNRRGPRDLSGTRHAAEWIKERFA